MHSQQGEAAATRRRRSLRCRCALAAASCATSGNVLKMLKGAIPQKCVRVLCVLGGEANGSGVSVMGRVGVGRGKGECYVSPRGVRVRSRGRRGRAARGYFVGLRAPPSMCS